MKPDSPPDAVLGIEIGGTKLQLGVSRDGGRSLDQTLRLKIERAKGAEGILRNLAEHGRRLATEQGVERIGVGFGGPVDVRQGHVVTSHQVSGWEGFPLASWCSQSLGAPAVLDNDCNVAALAEARFGAGAAAGRVFYVTVGTGIGGGMVIDGRLDGAVRPAVAEIGHLRVGLDSDRPAPTVESLASGPGIASAANSLRHDAACFADAQQVFHAAAGPDDAARLAIQRAVEALGWAIAQTITLYAPEIVVVGGGVSEASESLFWVPLRRVVRHYVFPPLADAYRLVAPKLGPWVVVHGAIARALD
jgi:glucokinase